MSVPPRVGARYVPDRLWAAVTLVALTVLVLSASGARLLYRSAFVAGALAELAVVLAVGVVTGRLYRLIRDAGRRRS